MHFRTLCQCSQGEESECSLGSVKRLKESSSSNKTFTACSVLLVFEDIPMNDLCYT